MHFQSHHTAVRTAGAIILTSLPSFAQANRPNTELNDPITHLEALVVTGSIEPKTAFDAAQGVAILDQNELNRRRASSLGETLSGITGVSSTYYGPGASRPVIRGFSGDRVKMLSNGAGTMDLSNISPDHAVAVEPSLAKRIEILRGPACLLYGNSAVGGVVNVIDGKVPLESVNNGGLVEGRYDTVSDGWTGLFDTERSKGQVAFKAQGLRTVSGDLRVPRLPLGEENEGQVPSAHRLAGSSISNKSGSVGSAVNRDTWSLGAALSAQSSFYGVPGGDEAIAIDLRQQRLDVEGQVTLTNSFIRTVRAKASTNRYRHHERDRESGEIHTTFRQKGGEGRLELQQQRQGTWSGLIGGQVTHADITSEGEETVTPPAKTSDLSLFTLQELAYSQTTIQAGLRLEHRRIRLGDVRDDLPGFSGYDAVSGEKRTGTTPAASLGIVYYPVPKTSIALSVSATERMPGAQELFSNGPHGGTKTYEVGNTSLDRERSAGFDLSLRRKEGFVTGSIGVFAHRFSNYITERRLPDDLSPTENNPEGLPAYQFQGTRALFTGAEADIAFHLLDSDTQELHLEFGADYVRATDDTNHTPLPRIPPIRFHSELSYESGVWYATLQSQIVARQNRVDPSEETETPGYVLFSAEAGRQWSVGKLRLTTFIRGQNLADRFAQVHTSFLKDSAPLPGRGFVLGCRTQF